eukprot:5368264-Prymnesium_polylepis.1
MRHPQHAEGAPRLLRWPDWKELLSGPAAEAGESGASADWLGASSRTSDEGSLEHQARAGPRRPNQRCPQRVAGSIRPADQTQ